MTLKNLLYNIAQYAIENKIINYSAAGPSLYQLNMETIKDYPILFASPTGNHNVGKNLTTYTITLYYIDRLTRGGDNDMDILSTSVEALKSIINGIKYLPGVIEIYDDYNITNFADTQKMSDNVAGAYATITIRTANNSTCPDGGIISNGSFIPSDNIVIKNQNKDLSVNKNGNYTLKPDNGYTGLGRVIVKVDVPNGSYEEGYEEGNKVGFEDGRRIQKELMEPIAITSNGTYVREDGYSEVIVTVPNTGLTTIDVAEYGIKFANSQLTEISEIFDFSNVTDYSYMFTNCKNLTSIPIGYSIVVDGSGDYAFYGSNIKIPSSIQINPNTSAFNMIGGCDEIITIDRTLRIDCDNFPFNIITNTTFNGHLDISLGESYVPIRDGSWGKEYQLFNNFDCDYIAIQAQPDQELEWLLKGCTADTILIGGSSRFYYDGLSSNGSYVFEVDNCRNLYLSGDFSSYGWRTLSNGERSYTTFIFDCEKVDGCRLLKGNFEFTNTNTNIDTIRNFFNNIGSVPVQDGCYIKIPNALLNQLTEDEISIVTNKGYSISSI